MFNLEIENFRGFNNINNKNNTLDISKTNILIGENSGGKTSFIKLLLLLKQSMETPNKDKKINLNGHLVDLGSFDTFINKSSNEKFFKVTFDIYGEEYINYYINAIKTDKTDIEKFVNDSMYFIEDSIELSFIFKKEENEFFTNNIEIKSKNIGKISFDIEDQSRFSILSDVKADLIIEHKKLGSIRIPNKLTIYGFMLLANGDNIASYGKEKGYDNFLYEMAFLLITQNFVAAMLRNMHYINPIKFHPSRIMLKRDGGFNGQINDFESLINALSALNDSNNDYSKEILENFNSAIIELNIADEIKLETNSSMQVSELKVKKSGIWSSIVDVGYGVGLQVPILLQAIICSKSDFMQTLIIEQPEIHLHPALHAKFIEVLIKYAGDTNLIIETHSEHIIRKIQVLVKKDILDLEKVKIYYFKNDIGTFDITSHYIDEDGKLQPPFPKGFYDNSYNLSKELY